MKQLQSILANPHTSVAGAVFILATGIEELGPVWFPSHAAQLAPTAKWLKGVAVLYGLAKAGDAKPVDSAPPTVVKPPV